MKTASNTLAILLILLSSSLGANAAAKGNSKDFDELSQKLETAIVDQNYKDAKQSLYELVPMMKQNIKETKKNISEVKKSNPENVSIEVLQEQLKSKLEIYDRLHHIVNTSSAAVRVKAKDILSMVKEFVKLNA